MCSLQSFSTCVYSNCSSLNFHLLLIQERRHQIIRSHLPFCLSLSLSCVYVSLLITSSSLSSSTSLHPEPSVCHIFLEPNPAEFSEVPGCYSSVFKPGAVHTSFLSSLSHPLPQLSTKQDFHRSQTSGSSSQSSPLILTRKLIRENSHKRRKRGEKIIFTSHSVVNITIAAKV